MEKGPKYYVECNVDVEERERERERCVETHPHDDTTWRKDRQIDRQKDGNKINIINVLIIKPNNNKNR